MYMANYQMGCQQGMELLEKSENYTATSLKEYDTWRCRDGIILYGLILSFRALFMKIMLLHLHIIER